MTPRIFAPILCLCFAASALAEEDPVLETRVFDVSALLTGRVDARIQALGIPGSLWQDASTRDDRVRLLEVDHITTLVETFVDPEVWLRDGVEFDWLDETRLSVTAPRAALEETATLLASLYRESVRRVEIHAELVTIDPDAAVRLKSTDVGKALLRGRLDARTRAAVLAAGRVTLEGAVSLRPGRLGRIAMTTSTSYVADINVEIASGSAVGDPIVRFLTEGWLLNVRPALLSDGSVWLEVLHQTAARTGPIRRVDPETRPPVIAPDSGRSRAISIRDLPRPS